MAETVQAKGADNSFIANLKEGFSSGVKSIGRDILPVWAQSKLLDEQSDQLAQPTYNSESPNALQRLDNLFGVKNNANGAGPNRALLYGGLAVAAIGLTVFLVRR